MLLLELPQRPVTVVRAKGQSRSLLQDLSATKKFRQGQQRFGHRSANASTAQQPFHLPDIFPCRRFAKCDKQRFRYARAAKQGVEEGALSNCNRKRWNAQASQALRGDDDWFDIRGRAPGTD